MTEPESSALADGALAPAETRRSLRARRASETPATPVAPRRSRKRNVVSTLVMALLVPALFGTVALPAYAFSPDDASAAQSTVQEQREAGAQAITVDAEAVAQTITRDGYSATTQEELDAAAAAAAEEERAANAAAYEEAADSTSDASTVEENLANPAYPDFSLASVYSVATQYQGVPYVYGGSTPAGFDCSGFVMYVYSQFGISLAHSVVSQDAVGTRISLADAVPGDIVVLDTLAHDGFYAGNGMILDAPKPGGYVSIRPIWTTAYHIVRIGI